MPLTTLDSKTALLVIDLQKGIASMPSVHPIKDVVIRTRGLADAFRHRHLPVVLVDVSGRARQAFEAGFNVTLAIDAMTDTSPDTHTNSITHIFPELGETGSTQEIIDLLEKRGA